MILSLEKDDKFEASLSYKERCYLKNEVIPHHSFFPDVLTVTETYFLFQCPDGSPPSIFLAVYSSSHHNLESSLPLFNFISLEQNCVIFIAICTLSLI